MAEYGAGGFYAELDEGIFKEDSQARARLFQSESARPREAYSI